MHIGAFFHGRLGVYMENKEYEEIEKSADILQKNASNKCNAEIQKAQNLLQRISARYRRFTKVY